MVGTLPKTCGENSSRASRGDRPRAAVNHQSAHLASTEYQADNDCENQASRPSTIGITGLRSMLRCSLIAGVFAATVALSACGASEAVPPTSAPVETPPTVTPEAASPTSAPVQTPPTVTPEAASPTSAPVQTPPTVTPEAASPTSAPVQTPPTVTPEAAWAIEDAYHSFGNPDAGVVVVNSQGGPMPALVRKREILEKLGLLNLERIHLVNVHQAQTINPAPFTAADITFDEAKAADGESVEVLAALVDHFQAQGKTVYVVGISFGAFMVQELLATQGNVAEGYLIANGRLDMPPTIWTVFAEGRTVGFVDGVEIEDPRTGGHEPAPEGTVPLQRNMARLAAGLGHYRYTERLAGVDMTNVVYLSGTLDEQVGRLSDAEVAFLAERGADVVQYDGGHSVPDAAALDAFGRLFPSGLLN